MWLLAFYAKLSGAATPLIHMHIKRRARMGKEHKERIGERFGIASAPRPQGKLVWVHGASIGETLSVLHFLTQLRARFPHVQLLLTSGTVTSAHLLATRMPQGCIHQFMPVDTPIAVARFLDHWKPDAGLMLESELWPNMLMACKRRNIPLALLNARMSDVSVRNWGFAPEIIGELLSNFSAIYAQSERDRDRYRLLGAKQVSFLGNLKEDAKPLEADETTLARIKAAIGTRPVFLAASVHPGEERIIAAAVEQLKHTHPNLLTILVPRHPERGKEMEASIGTTTLTTSRRTLGEGFESDVYIADTIGELGLWYRLCKAAFLGGSLIPHGGQNPLEAVRLHAPVIFGPHMFNFETIQQGLLACQGALEVSDAATLAGAVSHVLAGSSVASNASRWLEAKPPVAEVLLAAFTPLLEGP